MVHDSPRLSDARHLSWTHLLERCRYNLDPGVLFTSQLFLESACLAYAVYNEPEEGEVVADLFPVAAPPTASLDEERSEVKA